MKKKSAFLLLVTALCLMACSENEYEVHQTYFYPQSVNGMLFYADQETDTIRLVSFDSWTARSSVDWFTVSPTQQTVPQNTGLARRLDITATPNTTGKNRMGQIQVDSYFSIGMYVRQTSWLNVQYPSGRVVDTSTSATAGEGTSFEDTQMDFSMMVKADTASAEIDFIVYKDGATLRSSEAWLTAPADAYPAGRHKVKLGLEKNVAAEQRSATLTLSSNGVSTPIVVVQGGAKK